MLGDHWANNPFRKFAHADHQWQIGVLGGLNMLTRFALSLGSGVKEMSMVLQRVGIVVASSL